MTKKLDDYPEDEHDKDFDLGAATGATFDYEEYKNDEVVELSVAVRMLCNLGDRGEFYWRHEDRDNYDNMRDHVLNAIAAKKLNKLDKNRINVSELIQWAKQSGYPIPKQLKEIQQDTDSFNSFNSLINAPERKDDWFQCIIDHAAAHYKSYTTIPTEALLWNYLNNSELKTWTIEVQNKALILESYKPLDREAFSKRFKKYFITDNR